MSKQNTRIFLNLIGPGNQNDHWWGSARAKLAPLGIKRSNSKWVPARPRVAVCQNYNQTQKLSDCIKAAAGKEERKYKWVQRKSEIPKKCWQYYALTKSELYVLFKKTYFLFLNNYLNICSSKNPFHLKKCLQPQPNVKNVEFPGKFLFSDFLHIGQFSIPCNKSATSV